MNTSKMELDALTSKGVDNLSSALHRFDSIVNPCSRWCVLFDPVASHADQVSTLRRGQEEGKDAERYLIYVADVEGLFRCLLLAAFTEYARTLMSLIRFFDTEGYDAAEVTSTVRDGAHKLYVLFIQGRGFDIPGTYAFMVRDALKRVRTYVINNVVYTVGGLDASSDASFERLKVDVFKEMNAMVAMCIAVLEAEIPEFSVFHLFGAFNVRNLHPPDDVHGLLKKLAHIFHVDGDALMSQFRAVQPFVQRILANDGAVRSSDAWGKGAEEAGLVQAVRCDVLDVVLIRLRTYSGTTTSGVEHVHAVHEWLFSKRRGSLNVDTECDEVTLLCDHTESDEDVVIEFARLFWGGLYSGHRVRPRPNRNKGVKKALSQKPTRTLIGIAQERDRAVADASANSRFIGMQNIMKASLEASKDVWEDCMTEEINFNQDKKLDQKLTNLSRGQLVDSDVGVWDRDLAERRRQHKIELKRQRMNAADKRRIKLHKCCPEDLSFAPGTKVFLTETAVEWGVQPSPEHHLRIQHFVQVGSALEAELVVARSPGNLPTPILWECFLSGAMVLNHVALLGPHATSVRSKQGPTYCTITPAVATGGVGTKRAVWLSKRFCDEHPGLCASFRNAVKLSISTWKEVTKPQFLTLVHKNSLLPKRQQRDLQQIAVLAESQLGDISSTDNNLFTPTTLMSKFMAFDPRGSRSGACGI